jgi:hypothetical protein
MISLLPEPLPLDDEFLAKVKEDPVPVEQRFRFTNKCVESGCTQWTGKTCGVIENVLKHLDQLPQLSTLPRCSLRPSCRWFVQEGASACRACPYIITEITEAEVLAYSATELDAERV